MAVDLITFSIRFIEPQSLLSSVPTTNSSFATASEGSPPGTVKSIIPCTPLAVVKCLEGIGVYNTLLPYGDRAYGKTVSIINR
jgi:methylenetetrahydrofolate dehydrogenase (NAD+)